MKKAMCRKAINFDLDTKSLKTYYPGKNYRKAYSDIKVFMEKEGFNHRQYSGYVSNEKLSMQKITSLTKRLSKSFPWLKKCTNRLDVTDIGEQHDLTHIITGKVKVSVKEQDKQQSVPQKKSYFSREKLNKEADKIRKQPHKVQVKNRSQDRDI
jgi:virulence-associated protein VapD